MFALFIVSRSMVELGDASCTLLWINPRPQTAVDSVKKGLLAIERVEDPKRPSLLKDENKV